jgi:hypothetical protein
MCAFLHPSFCSHLLGTIKKARKLTLSGLMLKTQQGEVLPDLAKPENKIARASQ